MKQFLQHSWLLMGLTLSACGFSVSRDTDHRRSSKMGEADIALSGPPAAYAMDSLGAVSWLAQAGSKYYYGDHGQDLYVYIQLKGSEPPADKKRVPLNISLVLDRSGSMAGDKIAYARKAAAFVVEQLSPEDVLSIVHYDEKIDVMSPSAPVKNKEALISKINGLMERGSTNLTGGMLEGYAQVNKTKQEGYVNRVLLMTDGLANTGITDPQQIRKLASSMYLEKGVALSTFGVGADYNEDLLTSLAETGRANYYFIGNPDKIPGIFATELKGLLSVVAQNALVEVTLPDGVECVKTYGYPYEMKGNKVQVRLNDVYARDEKGILFKLRSRTAITGPMKLSCELQYTDAADFKVLRDQKMLAMEKVDNAGAVKEGEDPLVQEMIAMFEATESFDEVLARVDAGQYDGARALADSVVFRLQTKQRSLPSQKLKKQEEALAAYSKEINKVKTMRETEKKLYQKSNKSMNYESKKGKH